MAAHTLGRLVEAVDPAPAPPNTADPDYLSGRSGTLGRRGLAVGALKDAHATLRGSRARIGLWRAARRLPRRTVHVVGVVRPEHLRTVARLRRELTRSRHAVALHLVAPAPDAGKWANINAALAAAPVGDADWLLIVDDDVILPRGFLDRFLAARRGVRARARPARARLRFPRRVGRHPPPPARARPPDPLRRDRTGHGAVGRRRTRVAAVP